MSKPAPLKKNALAEGPSLRSAHVKRRRIGRYVLLAAAIGALGYCAVNRGKAAVCAKLSRMPMFTIRAIEVAGADSLEQREILAACGVRPGMGQFSVSAGRIGAAVRQLSWVADVSVTRRYPDRIRIAVRRREPVALICIGAVYGVDAKGVLLPLEPGKTAAIPAVFGIADTVPGPAGGLRLSGPAMARINGFLSCVRRADKALAHAITQIEFADAGVIRFMTGDGATVEIDESRTAEKLAQFVRLRSAMQDGPDRAARHINLCYNNLAFAR